MFVFVGENENFQKRLRTKTMCDNRVFESLITMVVCNNREFDCLVHRGYVSIRVFNFWPTWWPNLIPRIDTRRGLRVRFLIPAPLWFELATIRGRREGERVCVCVWGWIAKLLWLRCVEREIWRSRTRAFLCHWKFSWMRVGLQEYWWSFLFLFLFVSVCCNNDLDELCSVLILLGFSSWSRVCSSLFVSHHSRSSLWNSVVLGLVSSFVIDCSFKWWAQESSVIMAISSSRLAVAEAGPSPWVPATILGVILVIAVMPYMSRPDPLPSPAATVIAPATSMFTEQPQGPAAAASSACRFFGYLFSW